MFYEPVWQCSIMQRYSLNILFLLCVSLSSMFYHVLMRQFGNVQPCNVIHFGIKHSLFVMCKPTITPLCSNACTLTYFVLGIF